MSDLPAILDRRENLPGLLARAGQRLLEARTSAEVLEAKKVAEAALHLAKVLKATNETQADCLRIITRAEMRMADEIDRGQASGEIPVRGQHSAHVQGADMSDLGISRQRVAEWREIRDAGESVMENAISVAIAEGRAPSKSEILKAASEIRAERVIDKRRRREQREAELGARIQALPTKTYGLVMPDPPWRFEPYSRETGMDRAADNHYATTATAALVGHCPNMAADSGCFMWATAPMLEQALWLLRQWGFNYKSEWIWRKIFPGEQTGTGWWGRSVHEKILIGTRGAFPAPAPGQQPWSVIDAPVGAHSEKPAVFYEIIERLYPNIPKLEMYARGPRAEWDTWGAEAGDYDSDLNSARSYDLAIQALREKHIRSGEIEPRAGDEQEERWAKEGPREPRDMESVR